MRTTTIHHTLLASASLLLAACSTDSVGERVNAPRDAGSTMMVLDASDDPSVAAVDRPARTLATVETDDGGSVTFLDLGDDVAVSEIAAAHRPFVAQRLFAQDQATPLELFLAIGGSTATVPEALARQHRALRGATSAPRAFLPDRPGALDITTPGSEPFFSCNSWWYDEWKIPFVPLTRYQAASAWHPRATPLMFYPGSHIFHGTNTNRKTYLGACNGSNGGTPRNVDLEIHRKIAGAWVNVLTVTLPENTKHTFYSGVPSSYRGRAVPLNGPALFLGVGAAWTISPGLTN